MTVYVRAPIVNVESASNRSTFAAADLTAAITSTALDLEVSFIAGTDAISQYTSNPYFWRLMNGGTEIASVQLTPDGGTYGGLAGQLILTVGGSQRLLTSGDTISNYLAWGAGDFVTLRTWYYQSGGYPANNCGFRMSLNGYSALDRQVAQGSPAFGTPATGYFGSNAGTTPDLGATLIRVRVFKGDQSETLNLPYRTKPEFVILGDSTHAEMRNMVPVGARIYNTSERYWRRGIGGTALPGDTTAGQLTKAQGTPWWGDADVKAIFIATGINDIGALGMSAAQALAERQTAVNTIRAAHPYAKIISCTTIPWASYGQPIVDFYTGCTNGTITGVDAVMSSHYTTLGGGTNTLLVGYQFSDGNHENNAGRAVVGAAMRASLHSLGLLPAS